MKKNTISNYNSFIVIIILLGLCFTNLAQEKNQTTEISPAEIFKKIESGIENNDIINFADYLTENTFISLKNSSSGYYSINQIHYVLKDFLSLHKPVSFRFNKIVTGNKQPYATGLLVFSERGKRGSAIIYISLRKNPETWKISQLSIN